MRAVLLRVGIDTGAGGISSPLFPDGAFELLTIPDGFGLDERTYGNTRGRHGRLLVEYFPPGMQDRMRNRPMHMDPEFDTFTYGDPTSLKGQLRELEMGDLLIFYAGLEGWNFRSEPALYLVGYFVVETAGLAGSYGDEDREALFGANFHVRHPRVFAEQRNRLVLVKGAPESRLLDRAVRISEPGRDRSGSPIHVLSREMRGVFGDFGGRVAIQRSGPRWVVPEHVASAASFMRSL